MARETGPTVASTWTINNAPFLAGLREGERRAKQTGRAVTGETRQMSIGFAGLGRAVARAVAVFATFVVVRSALRESVVGAQDLQSAILKIGTLGPEQASRLKEFRDGILDIGKATGEEFPDLAGALFDINSAGIAAGDSIEFLSDQTKLAVAGFTDVRTAIQGTLGVLKGYDIDVSKAARVNDILFTGMQKGRTDIKEFATQLGLVVAPASQAGLSVEEMVAAISTITLVTGNTSIAVTQLKALLTAVSKNTDETRFTMQHMIDVGIVEFLRELNDETGVAADKLNALLGRQEAVSAATILAGSNFKDFIEILEATRTQTGVVEKASDDVANSFERQSARMKRTIEASLINFGEKILPTVNRALGTSAESLEAFLGNEENVVSLVSAFDTFVISVETAVDVLGVLGPILKFTAAGFVVVAAATTGSLAVAAKNVELLVLAVETFSPLVVLAFKDQLEEIKEAAKDFGDDSAATTIDILDNLTAMFDRPDLKIGKDDDPLGLGRLSAEALAAAAAVENAKKDTEDLRGAAGPKGGPRPAIADPEISAEISDILSGLGREFEILSVINLKERERLAITKETIAAINEIDFKLLADDDQETIFAASRDDIVSLLRDIEKLRLQDFNLVEARGFAQDLSGGVKDALAQGLADGVEDGEEFIDAFADTFRVTLANALAEALIGDVVKDNALPFFKGILGLFSGGSGPLPGRHFGGLALTPTIVAEDEPEFVSRPRDLRGLQGAGGPVELLVEIDTAEVVYQGARSDPRVARVIARANERPVRVRQIRRRRR